MRSMAIPEKERGDRTKSRLTDIVGLCNYLTLGRGSAKDIACRSGAVNRFGRMVRYDLNRVDKWVDEQ